MVLFGKKNREPEEIRLDLLALNSFIEENGITTSMMTTQVATQYAINFPESKSGSPLIQRKRPACPKFAASADNALRPPMLENNSGVLKHFGCEFPSRFAADRPAETMSKVIRHMGLQKKPPIILQAYAEEVNGAFEH